jgi:hypothetical protein
MQTELDFTSQTAAQEQAINKQLQLLLQTQTAVSLGNTNKTGVVLTSSLPVKLLCIVTVQMGSQPQC